MKEVCKLRVDMEVKGMVLDLYIYILFIYGECIVDNVDEVLRFFREMGFKGLD